MGWFDFLFNKKKKAPPEQLVLGAKLHCPHCVGDAYSYLWVDAKILDINHVPPANVDDYVAMHNIQSFGLCNLGGGTCDVCMKFDSPWQNIEPQGILADGKEAITMDSILSCSHGTGTPLEIISSGQDHLFASQIIFMKEMDLKYPGLRKILEDSGGSLYLNDGMYQMALQFLEDRINTDGGAVSLYILDDEYNPEAYYIKSALGHLEPAINVTSLQTYVDGFNAVMGRYDGPARATVDDHSLNGAMLDLLKRDCAENNRLIQAGGFYKWQEEHKEDLALLANWMRGAVGCSMMVASMMVASMITSGPGASVNSVEEGGWSEEVENVSVAEGWSNEAENVNVVEKNGIGRENPTFKDTTQEFKGGGGAYSYETGGRNLEGLSVEKLLALDDEAADLYNAIRNSTDDIAQIAKQTGIPEWKIQRIKNHVFQNEHILRDGIGRFDPDIEIADAWKRLSEGKFTQNDLDLLKHEYYEHRFEEFFNADYSTSHNSAVDSGRVWDPYKEVD